MQTVVITGGASGIGLELAEHYLRDDCRVHLISKTHVSNEELIRKLASDVDASALHFHRCDIGNLDEIKLARNQIAAISPSIDVLLNNAGFATYRLFSEMSIEEGIELANVNYVGHVAVTLAFKQMLLTSKAPQIVLMCSIAAALPITPNSVYAGAKAGMKMLGTTLRMELAHLGVNVCCVYPGRLNTPFFDHPTFKEREAGPETKLDTDVSKACSKIYKAIRSRKNEVYQPFYWGLFAYLYNLDPLVLARVHRAIVASRINRLLKVKS